MVHPKLPKNPYLELKTMRNKNQNVNLFHAIAMEQWRGGQQ